MSKLVPTPITAQHLVVMQEIIDFLQARGWDVMRISVDRWDESDSIMADTSGEGWKPKEWKWRVDIATAPRDQDTLPVRKHERT